MCGSFPEGSCKVTRPQSSEVSGKPLGRVDAAFVIECGWGGWEPRRAKDRADTRTSRATRDHGGVRELPPAHRPRQSACGTPGTAVDHRSTAAAARCRCLRGGRSRHSPSACPLSVSRVFLGAAWRPSRQRKSARGAERLAPVIIRGAPLFRRPATLIGTSRPACALTTSSRTRSAECGNLTAPNDNSRGPSPSDASVPDLFARSDNAPVCREQYVAGGPMAHATGLRLRRLLERLVAASGLAPSAFPKRQSHQAYRKHRAGRDGATPSSLTKPPSLSDRNVFRSRDCHAQGLAC
jgi:hypothetical protein